MIADQNDSKLRNRNCNSPGQKAKPRTTEDTKKHGETPSPRRRGDAEKSEAQNLTTDNTDDTDLHGSSGDPCDPCASVVGYCLLGQSQKQSSSFHSDGVPIWEMLKRGEMHG